MEPAKIKEEYPKLSKKYSLPSYSDLDDEFELLYLQHFIEINYPLRFIRRRIVDKSKAFINLFHSILNPNPSNLISLQESRFFNQEEKNAITELVKEIVLIEIESLILDVDHNEKKDAEFIKKNYKKWLELKKSVLQYSEKLQDGWKSNIHEEGTEHYFG